MVCRLGASALVVTLVVALVATAGAPLADSAEPFVRADGPLLVIRERESVGPLFIPPPDELNASRAQAARFTVTYSGFTPQAQAAFQYAVAIWQSLLTSDVPITVEAYFSTDLEMGILGGAAVNSYFAGFPGAPRPQTFYPASLANKLAGVDLEPTRLDITAVFNANYSDWYYGTDGRTPPDKFDLVTVVLHELAHGLGFAGSVRLRNGVISYGFGSAEWPAIYDRFTQNGAGQPILSFPNRSPALAAQVTGNNLFFSAPATNAANGGRPAKLFAPNPWQPGSSYAHLDEATYGRGNPNALMTPAIGRGEAIHNPGPVALAMLADMGWTAGVGPTPASRSIQALSVVVRDLRTPTTMATRTATATATASPPAYRSPTSPSNRSRAALATATESPTAPAAPTLTGTAAPFPARTPTLSP